MRQNFEWLYCELWQNFLLYIDALECVNKEYNNAGGLCVNSSYWQVKSYTWHDDWNMKHNVALISRWVNEDVVYVRRVFKLIKETLTRFIICVLKCIWCAYYQSWIIIRMVEHFSEGVNSIFPHIMNNTHIRRLPTPFVMSPFTALITTLPVISPEHFPVSAEQQPGFPSTRISRQVDQLLKSCMLSGVVFPGRDTAPGNPQMYSIKYFFWKSFPITFRYFSRSSSVKGWFSDAVVQNLMRRPAS